MLHTCDSSTLLLVGREEYESQKAESKMRAAGKYHRLGEAGRAVKAMEQW